MLSSVLYVTEFFEEKNVSIKAYITCAVLDVCSTMFTSALLIGTYSC